MRYDAAMIDLTGRVIGHYRVTGRVAGASESLWEATHELLGRRATVVVLPEGTAPDQLRQAREVSMLRIAGLADVLDYNLVDTTPVIVLDGLPAEDLPALVARRGALPPSVALAILRDVAEALDALHDAGWSHQRLRPAGVFVDLDDDHVRNVKLVDAGLRPDGPMPERRDVDRAQLAGLAGFLGLLVTDGAAASAGRCVELVEGIPVPVDPTAPGPVDRLLGTPPGGWPVVPEIPVVMGNPKGSRYDGGHHDRRSEPPLDRRDEALRRADRRRSMIGAAVLAGLVALIAWRILG
jgi:serine/threonine protein kinase